MAWPHKKTEVLQLIDAITLMGNPFMEVGHELLTLDNHECASESVCNTVRNIEQIGTDKYQSFVHDVLQDRTVTIHAPLRKSNLPTFKKPGIKIQDKGKNKIAALKQDCNLFSRLYITSQVRSTDMDEFFKHEKCQFPPSISDNGSLRLPSKKSELLECIDTGRLPEPPSQFDATIVDGAVIIHSLPVIHVRTFDDYATQIFLPWVDRQLVVVRRPLDVPESANAMKQGCPARPSVNVREAVIMILLTIK